MIDENAVCQIMAYSGAASRGFNMVADHINALSTAGIILLVFFSCVCLAATVTAPQWFPILVWRIACKYHGDIERIAVPRIGFAYPLIIYFFIFPVFGLFSELSGTWWIFLIFGWGAAAVILYYVAGIRKLTTGVMKAGGEWYISSPKGTTGWLPVKMIPNITIERDSRPGMPEYVVKGDSFKGSSVSYGHLSPGSFPESDRPFLLDFIRNVREKTLK